MYGGNFQNTLFGYTTTAALKEWLQESITTCIIGCRKICDPTAAQAVAGRSPAESSRRLDDLVPWSQSLPTRSKWSGHPQRTKISTAWRCSKTSNISKWIKRIPQNESPYQVSAVQRWWNGQFWWILSIFFFEHMWLLMFCGEQPKAQGRIPNTQCLAASKKILIRYARNLFECYIQDGQDLTNSTSPRAFPSRPRRSDTAFKSCKSARPSNNSGDRSPAASWWLAIDR